MQEFDVVIIGGGPIGIACGLEAKKQGISYIIIEKGNHSEFVVQLSREHAVFLFLREVGNRQHPLYQ